jgi:hypothetical protein
LSPDERTSAALYELASGRESQFQPAAGGRHDLAVVAVGELLLFSSDSDAEVVLPIEACRRNEESVLRSSGHRQVESSGSK